MLNISKNPINEKVDLSKYKTTQKLQKEKNYTRVNVFLRVLLVLLIIIAFLPWTQNITGRGYVTTLRPEQRPQTLQSPIPGRIDQWYVREGALVKKGDTLLKISEVKSEYFDDQLLERTNSQISAKRGSQDAYGSKTDALRSQITALQQERDLKYKQAQNKILQGKLKVESQATKLDAAETQLSIAQTQYDRVAALQSEGLKATKDLEEKRLKLQDAKAKYIAQNNDLLQSKNEVVNAEIELSRLQNNYAEKIAKAQGDISTALSSQYSTQADISKLENSYSNYAKRKSLHYITAPQDGYVNKAIKTGIGETFKEGESILNIMPAKYDIAVETYIRPIDLPLIHLGEKVRVQFDGWPAIVFSGWKNLSYGTYGGTVVAVETFISDNGMYRILLAPDSTDHPWPEQLRVGAGARTIALLQDVPIWYEVWRRLNGFPPNYYDPNQNKQKEKAEKPKIKVK